MIGNLKLNSTNLIEKANKDYVEGNISIIEYQRILEQEDNEKESEETKREIAIIEEEKRKEKLNTKSLDEREKAYQEKLNTIAALLRKRGVSENEIYSFLNRLKENPEKYRDTNTEAFINFFGDEGLHNIDKYNPNNDLLMKVEKVDDSVEDESTNSIVENESEENNIIDKDNYSETHKIYDDNYDDEDEEIDFGQRPSDNDSDEQLFQREKAVEDILAQLESEEQISDSESEHTLDEEQQIDEEQQLINDEHNIQERSAEEILASLDSEETDTFIGQDERDLNEQHLHLNDGTYTEPIYDEHLHEEIENTNSEYNQLEQQTETYEEQNEDNEIKYDESIDCENEQPEYEEYNGELLEQPVYELEHFEQEQESFDEQQDDPYKIRVSSDEMMGDEEDRFKITTELTDYSDRFTGVLAKYRVDAGYKYEDNSEDDAEAEQQRKLAEFQQRMLEEEQRQLEEEEARQLIEQEESISMYTENNDGYSESTIESEYGFTMDYDFGLDEKEDYSFEQDDSYESDFYSNDEPDYSYDY